MATSFLLELQSKPNRQGLHPVYIRITKDRKLKRIRTSLAIEKRLWNPEGAKGERWVSGKNNPNAAKQNDILARELEEAKALYREDRGASLEVLADKLNHREATESFLQYAVSVTDELAAEGRSNAKHYQTFCNKLQGFLSSKGKKDLTFSELTPAFLSNFESYLHKELNGKNKQEEKRLHPNYIRTLLVKFRALVNRAIKEGLLPASKYPFTTYTIPKEIATGKEALEESEVAAILALEYPEGCWLWHTKNAFLFSFYCAGIRVGDLLQLRWRNIKDEGSRLEYTMGKNHKQRNYPLVPQAKAILDLYRTESSQPSDYIFPLLDSSAKYASSADIDTMPVALKKVLLGQVYSKNAMLNKYLKRLAADAGISKNLSFHISRHTFASIARQKAVPSKVVQEALAHSSLSTTERYLHSFSTEEVGTALQKVFTSTESKQEALLEALKGLDKNALKELLNKLEE